MPKVISLINMKGGVGKSTLTVNLAWHFAYMQRKNILVVDLDPQFNASQYLIGVERYKRILNEKKPTVRDILEQNSRTSFGENSNFKNRNAILNVDWLHRSYRYVNGSYEHTGGNKIDLIPSTLDLAITLKNPYGKEELLEKALAEISSNYDLIFIDCPPTESILTTTAYRASDYLLVPVKPEYLSSIGLPLLVNSMNSFLKDNPNSNLQLAGIVYNMTTEYSPEEKLAKESVKEIAEKNNWYIFNNPIPYSRSFPKGAREGKPLFHTSYAKWSQKQRFTMFASEFAERINL